MAVDRAPEGRDADGPGRYCEDAVTSAARPPARGSGTAPLIQKLALATASVAVTLLLLEGALWLTGVGAAGRGSPWFAGGNHPRFLFVPAAGTGYALRAGFSGREVAASSEFQSVVEIDSDGLRRHPRDAPPGRAPLLALGDSMTYGEGVEAAEAFPALLEARLGRPVVNAGVPGYNSRQMVAAGQALADRLDPPLVLLVLAAAWDLDRCRRPFVYRDGYIVAWGWRDRLELVDGNLYAWEVRSRRLGPLTARLKGHSRLARLTLPALAGLARRTAGRAGDADALPPPEDWAACGDALEAYSNELAAVGPRLLVALADSPDPRTREATERVAASLAERGVPHLRLDDLLPADTLEARRFPRDRHWNPAGHRAVAAALAEAIEPHL